MGKQKYFFCNVKSQNDLWVIIYDAEPEYHFDVADYIYKHQFIGPAEL